MSGYDAPAEVRPLEVMLRNFSYSNGFSISNVFDDWLYFIIGNFNMNPRPQAWWAYTKEQNLEFHKMLVEWIGIMEKQVNIHGWYDVFGELYEACVASSGRRNNTGQFFTPPGICDFMTAVNIQEDKPIGKNVADPTCGSGRILLSFQAKCPGNFLFAEDIDRTCCMMTVANFIIHGAVGEVIWHDSLWPDSWNGGWKVNEFLNNPLSEYYGIPHMREIGKEESALMQYWENRAREVAKSRQAEQERVEQHIKIEFPGAVKPVQLTLWD